MKNYAEMSDFEINKAAANALGVAFETHDQGVYASIKRDGSNVVSVAGIVDYCNNWSDAGPITLMIWRELHMPIFDCDDEFVCTEWQARTSADENSNPLRAAMIVFLMMKDDETRILAPDEVSDE